MQNSLFTTFHGEDRFRHIENSILVSMMAKIIKIDYLTYTLPTQFNIDPKLELLVKLQTYIRVQNVFTKNTIIQLDLIFI